MNSRRIVWIGFLAASAATVGGRAWADEKLKDVACRSVHLKYTGPEGAVFYNEVTIKTTAVGTYFMVCGWDKGYFGIQEQGRGRKLLIFSVWDSNQNDPKAVDEDRRTKLLYKDEKMRIGRFGGEGTGGQSFYDYDWKVGETYRLMVSARPAGERTEYTGWFFVPEEKAWKKLVTFSTITGGKNLGGYYSFIEDFKRDRESTKHVRSADFSNAWIKTPAGDAVPMLRARFTADANPVLNINAVADGPKLLLATGGDVRNDGVKLKGELEASAATRPEPPDGLTLASP